MGHPATGQHHADAQLDLLAHMNDIVKVTHLMARVIIEK
jgi:hypothetical protein